MWRHRVCTECPLGSSRRTLAVSMTCAYRLFRIVDTLASLQTGLSIVVRQYAANGDDWTTGDVHLWGASLRQGSDPPKAYARKWVSPTPYQQSGVAAGPTGIALPPRCVWPGSPQRLRYRQSCGRPSRFDHGRGPIARAGGWPSPEPSPQRRPTGRTRAAARAGCWRLQNRSPIAAPAPPAPCRASRPS